MISLKSTNCNNVCTQKLLDLMEPRVAQNHHEQELLNLSEPAVPPPRHPVVFVVDTASMSRRLKAPVTGKCIRCRAPAVSKPGQGSLASGATAESPSVVGSFTRGATSRPAGSFALSGKQDFHKGYKAAAVSSLGTAFDMHLERIRSARDSSMEPGAGPR
ncbi:hypothetical protein FA15DRAFT_708963 [Coprinopsis marcescibilis]|uniref:Uncharacterized protein n=1 Tax=Coprinopsis marcescibilis TaxID=230819 RepID=A0A5C3KGW3_COPMA|nr:hypothetical protein FA15DRAFT_708963 [Coprinopsis marcescibilis]